MSESAHGGSDGIEPIHLPSVASDDTVRACKAILRGDRLADTQGHLLVDTPGDALPGRRPEAATRQAGASYLYITAGLRHIGLVYAVKTHF